MLYRFNFKKAAILLNCSLTTLLTSCSAGSNDTKNGYVYFILDSNIVQQCQVINNIVNTSSCKNMTGAFNTPTSIAFDTSKTYAYIANSGNNTLSMCTLNNDKSFNQCNELTLSGLLNSPTSLAITNNKIYIANSTVNITQCNINDDGTLSSCNNIIANKPLKSLTVKDNNTLYGLANDHHIYSYQLPNMTSTQVNYTESGVSNQINYNSTNNLLYIAAKNDTLLFEGGIYGCNPNSNPATCITAFNTLQAILPLPITAPMYTITTNNTQAYFIDYALSNPTKIDSYATLINSCSINGNGALTNCSASVLSSNKPNDNAKIALTYLPI